MHCGPKERCHRKFCIAWIILTRGCSFQQKLPHWIYLFFFWHFFLLLQQLNRGNIAKTSTKLWKLELISPQPFKPKQRGRGGRKKDMEKGSISHYLLPKKSFYYFNDEFRWCHSNRHQICMPKSDLCLMSLLLMAISKEEGKNTTESLTDNLEEIFFCLLVILPTNFWRKWLLKYKPRFKVFLVLLVFTGKIFTNLCLCIEQVQKQTTGWLAQILSFSEECTAQNSSESEGAAVVMTLSASALTVKGLALYSNTVIRFLQRPWLINQIFIHLCKYKLKQRIHSEPGIPTQVLFHVPLTKSWEHVVMFCISNVLCTLQYFIS